MGPNFEGVNNEATASERLQRIREAIRFIAEIEKSDPDLLDEVRKLEQMNPHLTERDGKAA